MLSFAFASKITLETRVHRGNAYRDVEISGYRLVVGNTVAGMALVSMLYYVKLYVIVDIYRVYFVQNPVGPGRPTSAWQEIENVERTYSTFYVDLL